jgi:type VI protein secretion system component VasF
MSLPEPESPESPEPIEPTEPPEPPVRAKRRWGRLAVIMAPVFITVLIAAILGGFIVVQSQRQSEQIEQADAVAADFLSQVATFRARAEKAIKESDEESPAAIRKALLAAIEDPPALADADVFGMENSSTYAQAAQLEADLLEPYERVSRELKKASAALAYVKAARKVLEMRITDYVRSTTLSSSRELRSSLIPAFVSARDTLAQVDVPKGQDDLDATVDSAVQYVIDQSSVLANSIDGGRNYSFTYAAQFEEAITAVEDYATKVTGDLTESLNDLNDLAN